LTPDWPITDASEGVTMSRQFPLYAALLVLLARPVLDLSIQAPAAPGPLVSAKQVSEADAFIQTHDLRDGDGGDKKSCYVDLTVKIKRGGTYIVRAGFIKDKRWHNGGILGTKFWDDKTIRGDAGDVIKVTIFLNKKPVFAEKSGWGIYHP